MSVNSSCGLLSAAFLLVYGFSHTQRSMKPHQLTTCGWNTHAFIYTRFKRIVRMCECTHQLQHQPTACRQHNQSTTHRTITNFGSLCGLLLVCRCYRSFNECVCKNPLRDYGGATVQMYHRDAFLNRTASSSEWSDTKQKKNAYPRRPADRHTNDARVGIAGILCVHSLRAIANRPSATRIGGLRCNVQCASVQQPSHSRYYCNEQTRLQLQRSGASQPALPPLRCASVAAVLLGQFTARGN